MPEFVGFQNMGILVPYGITFDAAGVCGLAFYLLFKSCSTYCARTLTLHLALFRWSKDVRISVKGSVFFKIFVVASTKNEMAFCSEKPCTEYS